MTSSTKHHNLVRHSIFLALVMGVANVANLVFYAAMGRMLSPADYSVMMVMISLLYVFNVPADALRTTMACMGADLGRDEWAVALFRRTARSLIWVAAGIFVMAAVLAPVLAPFFHMSGPAPVFLTAVAFCATFFMTNLHGILQGMQKFKIFGASVIIWFLVRLLSAVLLVWMGLATNGALGGLAVGALAAAVAPLWFLHSSSRIIPPDELPSQTRVFHHLLKTSLIYGSFMLLVNADVLLARRCLPQDLSAMLCQAALLGHIFWLLPLPLIMALVPKLIARRQYGLSGRLMIWRSMGILGLISAGLMVIIFCFPEELLRVFYGDSLHMSPAFLATYCTSLLPLGLLFLVVHSSIATGRFMDGWPIPVAVGSLYFWSMKHPPQTLLQLCVPLFVAGIATLAALLVIFLFRRD